ncbi:MULTISPECIES: hypothetical protein [Cyanophyceae]|uniref:hypothetical protein n=1 Tax=Cyanophyceae TaxID=3028117 RepID=UPI0016844D29|nr:hypothetical protein [Trichocoleus sp. FACHB-40]MBD2006339.1 hypothetical protein [Trichocoleus sp. FACHB-40]
MSVKFLSIIIVSFVLVVGCSRRDTSTPAATLQGHWVSDNKRSHWCFDDGTMYVYDAVEDKLVKDFYAILSQSPKSRSLNFKFGEGKGFEMLMVFSPDGKAAQAVEPLTDTTVFNFNYAGNDVKTCGAKSN